MVSPDMNHVHYTAWEETLHWASEEDIRYFQLTKTIPKHSGDDSADYTHSLDTQETCLKFNSYFFLFLAL